MAYEAAEKIPDWSVELRERLKRRHTALKGERSPWDAHWRDLVAYGQPRRSRFLNDAKTQGSKRNEHIINSVGIWALQVLAAGMMAGITSPARKWLGLTVADPRIADDDEVRSWCEDTTDTALQLMARSNIYDCLHSMYLDLGNIGTSMAYVEECDESIFRGYVAPVGQYCLVNGPDLEIEGFFRELVLSVEQVVTKFCTKDGRIDEGMLSRLSSSTRTAWDAKKYDATLTVVHVVEPNPDADERRKGPQYMAYRGLWFEADAPVADKVGILGAEGFNEKPFVAPRWQVASEESYGSSPGMDALGDNIALQEYEKQKALAIEKMVDPAMLFPAAMQAQRVSMLPGQLNYVSGAGADQARAAYAIPPTAISAITESIREHETRIKQAFKADLWLMIAEADGRMTATEVAERQREKMLQLGPVMESIERELLAPLVNRVLAIMFRRGLLPKAPKKVQGMELMPRYTSIMAQAQRLLDKQQVQSVAAFVGSFAGIPSLAHATDKLNVDEAVKQYAEAVGAPPSILRTDEEVAQIRQQQAAMAAKQQQMADAQQMAQGAQTLSQVDTKKDSLLTDLMGGGLAGVEGASA